MRLPPWRRRVNRAERIAQLALPEPFDLFAWRDNLAARRQRPIELWPCGSDDLIALTGESGVHAFLLSVGDRDVVCYKADIPRFMVEHNLIHEFCHLACDHRAPLVVNCDLARLDQIFLTRTSAPSERRELERETEELTLWVERYRGDGALPLATPDGPLPSFYGRAAAVLGNIRAREEGCMWPADVFYLTIACCWLMACFAIRRPPWETGAIAQTAYRRSIVAYSGWCTLFLPPVYRTVDRIMGLPNGTRLILAVTAIVGAYVVQPWLHWFVPPGARGEHEDTDARGRGVFALLDSPALLVVALLGAVASFFLVHRPSGVASAPLNGQFLVAYGRDRWLLAFLLLTHGYVGGVYLRLIGAYLPVIRTSLHRFPEPVARYRFQFCVYVTMLGLLYNLHELARALLYYAGLPAHPASHSAVASLVLALYNVAELWCFYGSFRWLAHYLAYRQLGPIWWALYRTIPTMAHRSPGPRPIDGIWLGPRAVGDRLRSRIYGIWDGISTLYPYRSAALARRTRAACAAAGLPDEETIPVVEVVLLRACLAARERQRPPVADRWPLPELTQESFGEQIAFLQRVAWAWAHSPTAASLRAEAAGADDGPVPSTLPSSGHLPGHHE